ncbi:MAG: hypothetical protein WA919_08670 [Coleofasciculaceae cyanobacterium]
MKPLENDLATAEAETIIYAPDGQLRYLPLAALYDGEQWLETAKKSSVLVIRCNKPKQELLLLPSGK